MKKRLPLRQNILLMLLLSAGWVSAQTVRYVAPGGSNTTNCATPGSPCATISYAVSQANAGDEIRISAGTYAEAATINISKANLTFQGAGASTTTVKLQTSNSTEPVFTQSANGATLKDLTLTNDSRMNGGVWVNGASIGLTVDSVRFTNIGTATGMPAGTQGSGIRFMNTFSKLSVNRCLFSSAQVGTMSVTSGIAGMPSETTRLRNLNIQNSKFEYLFIGFWGPVPVDTLVATGNTFGPWDIEDANSGSAGIYMGDLIGDIKNIRVENNLFIDYTRGFYINNYSNAGVDQSKVLNINISRNTFTNSIYSSAIRIMTTSDATLERLLISENIFNQSEAGDDTKGLAMIDLRQATKTTSSAVDNIRIIRNCIYFTGASYKNSKWGLLLRGQTYKVQVLQNTFSGGNRGGYSSGMPATSGIVVQTNYESPYGSMPSDAEISVKNNFINGFVNGVIFYDSESGNPGGIPNGANISIHENHLAGNTDAIVNGNAPSATIAGASNWYGTTDPAAIQAMIEGNVNFTPVLLKGEDAVPGGTGPCGNGFQVSSNCSCVEVNLTLNDTTCTLKLTSEMISMASGTFCSPGLIVRVSDGNPLNGDIIDCPGYWTYGLFMDDGTLVCWGRVRVEDKSGPKLERWVGRCNKPGNGTEGVAPAQGAPIESPFLDPSEIREDTFLCMDIEQVYNVSASWTNPNYEYFAGAPTFQDGCHNRTYGGSAGGSGNPVLCDCRTDVLVNDQIVYYTCPAPGLPFAANYTGVWAQITRVFTATDCAGNRTTMTQKITFVRPPITRLAKQVADAGGSFSSDIGDGSKTRIFLDDEIVAPNPRLMVIMDSATCDAEADAELMRKLRSWYYIFDDTLKCDGNVRDDYAYFTEGASVANPRRPLLQCNYSFESQITATYPVCEGRGKKVLVTTSYFDWCTGVKLPLDTVTLKDYDNLPPRFINKAKEQVVISTGPLECTASFGIDKGSLLEYFGIDVQDNEGGCGVRDVNVLVESCIDSSIYGIIVENREWRTPVYQTANVGSRRMIYGVPVGQHRLIITATDLCYSQKDTTVYFQVKDNIAPQVKCTDTLNVTLTNTIGAPNGQSFPRVGTGIYGYARVLASQINAGTTDNCDVEWVRVRRAIPLDNELGLLSYYEALKNDPRFVDADTSGTITHGDGYDWNGNGDIDFGVIEQFRDTILPLQSSTSTIGALMTPLLNWVDFFCSDYDQSIMVELWAMDKARTLTICQGQPNGTQGGKGYVATMTSGGNLNYCWMNVLIEDKVAPTFIRPWDVTATCLDRAWLDTLALALSIGTLQLDLDNFTGAVLDRTAGSNHALLYRYIEQQILSRTQNGATKDVVANNRFVEVTGGDCGRVRLDVVISRPSWHCDAGEYKLTYRPQKLVKDVWQYYDGPASWPVTSLGGGNVTTITVSPVHEYNLRFPADISGDCANLRDTANVVDGGELSCDVLAVLVQDKRYNGATKDGAPVAECYKIFRTFTVVNWCQYDDRCGEPMNYQIIVPRDPNNNGFNGVNVLVRDADRDRTETIYYQDKTGDGSLYPGDGLNRMNPGNPNDITDAAAVVMPAFTPCQQENYKGGNNGNEAFVWSFTQYIFVHDTIAPVLAAVDMPQGGFIGYQNKETCGGQVKIVFSSSDGCAATEIQENTSIALERVWLNPNGSKVQRQEVPSSLLSPVPPILTGDNKSTQPTQVWTYEINAGAPNTPMRTESLKLTPGQHSLTVVARDDCGNLSRELDIPFTILDTTGTPPICINGLSTNLVLNPQTGQNEVVIWATDFKAPSEIWDCSGQGATTDPSETASPKQREMITNENYFVYLDEDPAMAGFQNAGINPATGRPVGTTFPTFIKITCDKLGLIPMNPPSGTRSVLVRVYTRDNASQYAGNTNNWAWCETFVSVDNASICPGSGSNTSSTIAGVIQTESSVEVEGVEVNLSGRRTVVSNTDVKGQYSFAGLERGYDYSVTPKLDKNHQNGVSTFDLILIAKHILGMQPLTSPYKLIAADANNSKTVTTVDLVHLRRLILGVDDKLASNTSWRFVDATYRFPSPANPWTTQFPEVSNINDLEADARADFIAIKIGDVNGSATGSGSIRANGTFYLQLAEQELERGKEYRLPLTGDLGSIEGVQFTLQYDKEVLELVNIEYGIAQQDHFGIFAGEGVITASWNGQVSQGTLGTLVFRAIADAPLSEVVRVNSRYTKAEAYTRDGGQLDVDLQFAGAERRVSGFELQQNTPNPFKGETVIGFTLPSAGEATLTIQDVTGRTLRVLRGQYSEGYNQVLLKSADLGATGVLYYTLEAGEFMATRRMVIIE